MGDWIGFVGKKDNQHDNNVKLDINLLKQEERAFWSLERPLRDQLNALNEKYKKAEENYQTAKMWLNSKSIQLEEMKSKLCDKEEIEKELAKKIQENEKYVDQLKKTAIELIQEQQFLKEVKQQLQLLNARYQQIYRQNKLYEEKLNKIYCTWYGKIALKAYKLLKKIKHLIMRH